MLPPVPGGPPPDAPEGAPPPPPTAVVARRRFASAGSGLRRRRRRAGAARSRPRRGSRSCAGARGWRAPSRRAGAGRRRLEHLHGLLRRQVLALRLVAAGASAGTGPASGRRGRPSPRDWTARGVRPTPPRLPSSPVASAGAPPGPFGLPVGHASGGRRAAAIVSGGHTLRPPQRSCGLQRTPAASGASEPQTACRTAIVARYGRHARRRGPTRLGRRGGRRLSPAAAERRGDHRSPRRSRARRHPPSTGTELRIRPAARLAARRRVGRPLPGPAARLPPTPPWCVAAERLGIDTVATLAPSTTATSAWCAEPRARSTCSGLSGAPAGRRTHPLRVELWGIEPQTSSMPWKRSTN